MVGTNEHARMRNNRIFYVCAWVIKQGWHQCACTNEQRSKLYGWHPCAFDEDSFMASLKFEQ